MKMFLCEVFSLSYNNWDNDIDETFAAVANSEDEALGMCLMECPHSKKSDWDITEIDPTKHGLVKGVY